MIINIEYHNRSLHDQSSYIGERQTTHMQQEDQKNTGEGKRNRVSITLDLEADTFAALESLRQQMGLRSYEVLINGLLRELLIDSTSMKSKQDGQAQAGNRQKTHRIYNQEHQPDQ